MADVFDDGDAYERFMGRWSRLVAPAFVAWLSPRAGLRWLDVGCGTGALTSAVLAGAAPREVVAVDPSPEFVESTRRTLAGAPVAVRVGSAEALPADDESVDLVVSGLVLTFLPDVAAALREQVRVVRPGGAIAAYVWDYGGGMPMVDAFWRAAAAVDPELVGRDERVRFPIARPEALRAAWEATGLTAVAVEALTGRRRFASFDEIWAPFLGGQGPAGGYLAGLDDPLRAKIADAFRARLPVADDGSAELSARAWAVRGTVHT